MAGVLTRLSQLFGGQQNFAAVPQALATIAEPPKAAETRLEKEAKAVRERTNTSGGMILSEKIPHRYGPNALQIRFEPWVDSATEDTPEIREAMMRMLRSPWVKAAWMSQVFDVASQDWQVNPCDEDDPMAVAQAKFIHECITRLPMGAAGLIMAICSGLGPQGVTVVEVVDELQEDHGDQYAGKIMPVIAKAKDTSKLRIIGDNFRNITWIEAITAGNQRFEVGDFLVTQYMQLFAEPLGQAAFRASYAAWWMLDTAGKLRSIHHEKRSSGTMLGTYQNLDEKAELENALKALKTSTWAAVPEGVKIEVLALTTASDTDYKAFESDKKAEVITGITLASLHIMEGNVSDARGNTQVQRDVAELGTWYMKQLVESTINRQFVPKYIRWNFADYPGFPVFSIGQITQQDAKDILDTVEKAQKLGFKLSKKHYAKAASLQLADENDEDDVLMPPGQGPDDGGGMAAMLGGSKPPDGGVYYGKRGGRGIRRPDGSIKYGTFNESQWSNPWQSFAWRAGKSRTGNVKAIGSGEDEGRTLYGKPAERALAGRELDGGDRESHRDRRKAVVADRAKAVSIARRISSHDATDADMGELIDHLPKLRREELSKVRTMLMARLGGEKRVAGIVEKLKGHIRGRMEQAGEPEPTTQSTDLPAKPGAGAQQWEQIGKGSTGIVESDGASVRKAITKKEAAVYNALKGVPGIAPAQITDKHIVTPRYKNVVSVDDVPFAQRKSMGPIVAKAFPRLAQAITALTDAGFDYNDPLQVGFTEDRQADIFDFSMAAKVDRQAAASENLDRLSMFLGAFGANRLDEQVSRVAQVFRQFNDLDNPFMEGEPETEDAKAIARQLGGKEPKYLYFSTNARTIPGVAQSEHRDGMKVIASDVPLGDDVIKQWEITPVLHPHAPSEPTAQPEASPATPDKPGFTGIDSQGREWRDGELVHKGDEPTTKAKPKKEGKPKGQRKGPRKLSDYIKSSGGIDPDSHDFQRHFKNIKEAMEHGIPMSVFRKGGRGLDELAESLHREGAVVVPEGKDASQHVVEELQNKAYSQLEDMTDYWDRKLEEHYRMEEEQRKEEEEYARTYGRPEVSRLSEEADRTGQAEALGEFEKDPLGESEAEYRDIQDGEELDDSFDFGLNAGEKDTPAEPIKSDLYTDDYQLDIFGNKQPIPKTIKPSVQPSLIPQEVEAKENVRVAEEVMGEWAKRSGNAEPEGEKLPRDLVDSLKYRQKLESRAAHFVQHGSPEAIAKALGANVMNVGDEFRNEFKRYAEENGADWDHIQKVAATPDHPERRMLESASRGIWDKVTGKINAVDSDVVLSGLEDLGSYGLDSDSLTKIEGVLQRNERSANGSVFITGDVKPPAGASAPIKSTMAPQPQPSPTDEPGFTGTDAQGREWRDGELVAAVEDATPQITKPTPQTSEGTPQVGGGGSEEEFWASASYSPEKQTEHDVAYREFTRLQTSHLRGHMSPPPVRKIKHGRGEAWEVFDPDTGNAYASYKTKDEATKQASSRWGSEVGSLQIDAARERYQKARKELARDAVESALSAGKPVPDAVLADYPDLAAKYGQPGASEGSPPPTVPATGEKPQAKPLPPSRSGNHPVAEAYDRASTLTADDFDSIRASLGSESKASLVQIAEQMRLRGMGSQSAQKIRNTIYDTIAARYGANKKIDAIDVKGDRKNLDGLEVADVTRRREAPERAPTETAPPVERTPIVQPRKVAPEDMHPIAAAYDRAASLTVEDLPGIKASLESEGKPALVQIADQVGLRGGASMSATKLRGEIFGRIQARQNAKMKTDQIDVMGSNTQEPSK